MGPPYESVITLLCLSCCVHVLYPDSDGKSLLWSGRLYSCPASWFGWEPAAVATAKVHFSKTSIIKDLAEIILPCLHVLYHPYTGNSLLFFLFSVFCLIQKLNILTIQTFSKSLYTVASADSLYRSLYRPLLQAWTQTAGNTGGVNDQLWLISLNRKAQVVYGDCPFVCFYVRQRRFLDGAGSCCTVTFCGECSFSTCWKHGHTEMHKC